MASKLWCVAYGCWLWAITIFLLQKFLVSLSNTAKVYTFQTVTASLRIALDVENEQAVKVWWHRNPRTKSHPYMHLILQIVGRYSWALVQDLIASAM